MTASAQEEAAILASEDSDTIEAQQETTPELVEEGVGEEFELEIPETSIEPEYTSEDVVAEKRVVFYERKEIGPVSAPSAESFKQQPVLHPVTPPKKIPLVPRPPFTRQQAPEPVIVATSTDFEIELATTSESSVETIPTSSATTTLEIEGNTTDDTGGENTQEDTQTEPIIHEDIDSILVNREEERLEIEENQ